MTRFLFFFSCLALMTWGASLRAEDWTTTDGKAYQEVKVVRTEPDAVTILHHDGGALVPLKNLAPDLQKRFHYDPARAQAAAADRARAEIESAKALQAEVQVCQHRQELVEAEAIRLADATAPVTQGGGLAEPESSAPQDPNHHTMGELIDPGARLRFDHDLSNHYTMNNLVTATGALSTDPGNTNHHSMGDLFHSGSNL